MYNLSEIDLGNDEAEQDARLQDYFLKTQSYKNTFEGKKTIIVGRKGSGKSAIFTLMRDELEKNGNMVIPMTPDQYSWQILKEYKEQGIIASQAHINAWKMTFLMSIIWKLRTNSLIKSNSKLMGYYNDYCEMSMDDANWLHTMVQKATEKLSSIQTPMGGFGLREKKQILVPLSITSEIVSTLKSEWPTNRKINIIIDRLDDSWDASEESVNLIIGLLKAANQLNTEFSNKAVITIFLRSDIYDNLFFDDQDKLRQYEETLSWSNDELKDIISERVRVSLDLSETNNTVIWNNLFSQYAYRSKATAEKYIIDRTFKRPRDIISFVRLALEVAVKNKHTVIETIDTREAEEDKYSTSKYKDLIIEYNKQFSLIKDLLDFFSGSLHKSSKDELKKKLADFLILKDINNITEDQLLSKMFVWGIIGIKRQGRSGVKQRGGSKFYYYYDDPSINPLAYQEYYIHPSLRYHLNISEKREKIKR